jgi:hypothetical protein
MITMNKNIYFYGHKSGLSTIHDNLTVVSTFSGGVCLLEDTGVGCNLWMGFQMYSQIYPQRFMHSTNIIRIG